VEAPIARRHSSHRRTERLGQPVRVRLLRGAYIGILILLSSKARFWEGVGYLLLYNIFFALPLVVVLLLGTTAENLVRIDRWRVLKRRQMKAVTGVFMILLAVATYYWAFL